MLCEARLSDEMGGQFGDGSLEESREGEECWGRQRRETRGEAVGVKPI